MDKDSTSSSDPNDNAATARQQGNRSGSGRSAKQQQGGVLEQSSIKANSMSGTVGQDVGFLNNPAVALSLNNLSQKIPLGTTTTNTTNGSSLSCVTNDHLLSALSMLVSASNSSGSYGQIPASTVQQPYPQPVVGTAALLPHLLQLQQQQGQVFPTIPHAATSQPPPRQTFGLNNQQLISLLLQQQTNSTALFNPVGTNSGRNVTSINALAQTSGAISGSDNNSNFPLSFQRPASCSGLELGTILSALSNTRNQQAAASASAAPTAPLPLVTAPLANVVSTTHAEGGNTSYVFPEVTSKSHSRNSTGDKAVEYVREVATSKGARLLPCRARGMPMDHNIHVSAFSSLATMMA
jgi:hypothetical protein